ncbi:transcriptional regulator, partial [Streptomyces sp. NRRL S-495]|uniref:transcriptional regulator n=1 Tax=Streptomyces sp. NRRL S-495 TaxID=1609133 RepID=UPI000A76674D
MYPAGPLAVLEAAEDGTLTGHLVDGRTLACPARSLPAMVTWALGAGLGQARLHKWGTDADPMIVLTASAATKLGLPDQLEDRRQLRLPEDHKVVKALTKAGWQLTRRGFSSWTRVYKPVKDGARQCVQIAVMPWDALGPSNSWAVDPDTAPADVARILGTYAQRVIAPRGSMGTNGIELLLQLRPPTRAVWDEAQQRYVSGPVPGSFTRAVQPAPPDAPEEHPLAHGRNEDTDAMHEEAWNWHRPLTPEEETRGFTVAVGLDTNTSFSRVEWDPRFPCPLTANGRPPTGPAWYTTQTLAYALELGLAVEPSEAWLRRPAAAAWLDPWQEHLARAYKDTMAALGIVQGMEPEAFLAAMEAYNQGAGDPVERQLARYVKQTVKSGIGKLRQSPARYIGYTPGEPWPELERLWWRPDVRAAVIATARVSQHRKMLKTFEATGLAPLVQAGGRAPARLVRRAPRRRHQPRPLHRPPRERARHRRRVRPMGKMTDALDAAVRAKLTPKQAEIHKTTAGRTRFLLKQE